jgi:hypothetical protein
MTVDQVATAVLREIVQQRVDERGDLRLHGQHPSRAEGRGDQPAQPRVDGRVGHDHPVGHDRHHLPDRVVAAADRGEDRRDPVRRHPRVGQPGHDVVVAQDDPRLVAVAPMHWRPLAQRVEHRVRVGDRLGGQQVERGVLHRGDRTARSRV